MVARTLLEEAADVFDKDEAADISYSNRNCPIVDLLQLAAIPIRYSRVLDLMKLQRVLLTVPMTRLDALKLY